MVVEFQGEIFSASLQEVSLRHVLEELERRKGIWFKGANSLFDEKVAVQFNALSLEDGIKRILTSNNYSLVFDRTGEVAGVVVLGRMASDAPTGEGGTTGARRDILSKPSKRRVNDVGAFEKTEILEVTRKSQPTGDPVAFTDKDLERFKAVSDILPPGGPVEVSAEELENFTVIRNAPPPGGPVNVIEEELEKFEIIKNCPPPGGPVEVTADELQNFEIIKDSPPPENE
jgi:hypothetical protein